MSETKGKLQLLNNINTTSNDANQKLLINHGKPNFTINRQGNNYKKYHIDSDKKSNEIDKIVLKNVSLNVTPSNKTPEKIKTHEEFLEKFKKISTKTEKSDQNIIQVDVNHQVRPEFFKKYEQISEKMNNSRDEKLLSDEGLNSNCIYDTKIVNENGTRQFTKMTENRIQKAEIIIPGSNLPPGAICGKPFIPAKPDQLILTSSPTVNCNEHKNDQSIPSNGDMISNTNGSNFQHKTIVSFSRDLSNAQNTYPDKAKIITYELKSKMQPSDHQLKFSIDTTGNDVVVKPVIR